MAAGSDKAVVEVTAVTYDMIWSSLGVSIVSVTVLAVTCWQFTAGGGQI
jgi:hypothetical protein